jgi:hypothetical protein
LARLLSLVGLDLLDFLRNPQPLLARLGTSQNEECIGPQSSPVYSVGGKCLDHVLCECGDITVRNHHGVKPAEKTELGSDACPRAIASQNYNGRERSIFRTQESEGRARNGMPFIPA